MFKFTLKFNDLSALEHNNINQEDHVHNSAISIKSKEDLLDIQTLDIFSKDTIQQSSSLEFGAPSLSAVKNSHNLWLYTKNISGVVVITQLSNGIISTISKLMNYTTDSYLYIMLYSLTSSVISIISLVAIVTIYCKIINKKSKNLVHSDLSLRERVRLSKIKLYSLKENDIILWFSHQLRNPLQILSYALHSLDKELITINKLVPSLKEPIEEALKNALLSSKQMEIVINGILEVAELETAAELLVKDEKIFTLGQLVELVFDYIKVTVKNKQLQLICKSELSFDLVLKGNVTRIAEILIIFLVNSAKFTQQNDYIKLFIRLDKLAISLVDQDTVPLHFSVQDNGIGLSKSQIKKLFITPFCSAIAGDNEQFNALGLGLKKAFILANSSNIVCPIGVYSSGSHKGATFWVRGIFTKCNYIDPKLQPLILARSSQDQSEENQPLESPPQSACDVANIKVLVVEDSKIIQLIMQNMLHKLGCIVTTVSSGEDAINIIKQAQETAKVNVTALDSSYNLIFMDLVLSGAKDGKETAYEIRKLGFDGIIIACTGNATEKDKQECFAVGMNEFIVKPVNEQIITKMIVKFFMLKKNSKSVEISASSLDSLNQSVHANDTAQSLLKRPNNVIGNNQLLFKVKSQLGLSEQEHSYSAIMHSSLERTSDLEVVKESISLEDKGKNKIAVMPRL